MTARRRQLHMPVSRCGLVTRDRTTTLCEILDITDQGLHFSTDLLLSENDTVRIECAFLLRCRSLQSLTPATVGAYHNLIPICTIAIAHLSLGEPVTAQTMTGALAVLLGTELVRRKPAWSALSAHKRFLGLAFAAGRSSSAWGTFRKTESDTHRFRPSKGGYI